MQKARIGLATAMALAMATALTAPMAQAATTATPTIPGVQAVDWNHDGTYATRGASAVFYDQAHGLLWSNTSIDLGHAQTFEQASSLLAAYNASGSIEGVTNWTLPTVDQFKLLYATQGPDTVTNNGMEKRVFDGLSTYVWTGTPGAANGSSHEAFGANFALNAPGQFNTFANYRSLGVWAVAAVPEPQTYAMLLAGLACIGLVARRRQAAGSAAGAALTGSTFQ